MEIEYICLSKSDERKMQKIMQYPTIKKINKEIVSLHEENTKLKEEILAIQQKLSSLLETTNLIKNDVDGLQNNACDDTSILHNWIYGKSGQESKS